jgi:CHAT domain-containing protein
MVYDLELLERLPGHVIISSCDLGLNRVVPGDELLGLTAALFAHEVHTVIAASQVVDDAAACELMVGYHERLRRGEQPARALAGAASAVRATGDLRAEATAAAFGCYGAGWSTPT